jgi:glycosyltransferase involved in cell wall biosynthesis
MQRVSIIIPIYNEVLTCKELLDKVSEKTLPGYEKEIIIVESNSTDGSREVAQGFAKNQNIRLILEDRPNGKGFAVRKGLEAATGDIIMIQDADLEYDTNDYDRLLKTLTESNTSFVLGSRHLGKDSWKIRTFHSYFGTALIMNLAHHFFTFIINTIYSQKLTDPATMYKVFYRSCLKGINFSCSRFDFDFELVCKLILNGYHPIEIPVSYDSRGFAAGKKVRFFRDPLTWVKVIIMTRVKAPNRMPFRLVSSLMRVPKSENTIQ